MKRLKRNEMLLLFGKWTSYIGNIVFDYANSTKIVHLFTLKPHVMAIYQSSETLAQILFNLIGGAIADSGDRKKIVIFTDLAAAFLCFALSFFIESTFVAEILILVNIVIAVIFSFNSPTYTSIVREVIERERIGFFNSLSNAGTEVLRVAGPLLSFFLIEMIGIRGAMIFNATTFLLSAISEVMLVRIEPVHRKEKNKIFLDIKDGICYLVQEKKIFYLVFLSALVNFFLAGYNLLIPYTDVMYQHVFEGFYSKALAMQAVGGLIGSFISSKLDNKKTENELFSVLFLGIAGLFLLLIPLCGYQANLIVCLLPFLGFGATLTGFNIQFMSYIQMNVAPDFLGRVFSVIFTVAVSFMPIGSFVASLVCNISDVDSFYCVGGGIILSSVVFGFLIKNSNVNSVA